MTGEDLEVILEQRLGSKIVARESVSGGCISQACIITLASGECCFLKSNAGTPNGFFAAEATGLDELRKGEILIPEVIAYEDNPGGTYPSFIVLEFLEPGHSGKKENQQLGEQLARLHRSTADRFGFIADNFIGSLEQRNKKMARWGDFFFETRLAVQAELGRVNGWFDHSFEALLNEKQVAIREELNQTVEPPTLRHGDLWSGNVFWSTRGPALIDPAVYYGNREADLAFTELFGRFSEVFYQVYNDTYPLEPGYARRKSILNLYHLMTHSNLFGGSYISSARAAVGRI